MDQRIIDLYDDFVHVHFDRRLFLERAAKIVGSMGAATALLPLLQSNYAIAATIAENDARITVERVSYKGASGDVKAYLARPKADGKRGSVIVVHQNRGLNPHIQDLARRFAVDGYNALAVDFLSQLGGSPTDEDEAMKMYPKLDGAKVTGDANAATVYLRSRADSNGKVGSVGFCWGGGVISQMSVTDPTLNAGVIYYGAPPAIADVAKIKTKLLAHYGDVKLDTRLGALLPDFEKALKDAKVDYKLYVYEGANHAFNDDTQSARYDAKAAKTAWDRTLEHFKANVA